MALKGVLSVEIWENQLDISFTCEYTLQEIFMELGFLKVLGCIFLKLQGSVGITMGSSCMTIQLSVAT